MDDFKETTSQATPQAPAAPKKVRRIGRVAFAVLLIAAGVLLLIQQFVPHFDLLSIVRFTPVLLILLGIEVLVYSARPDVKVKFDWLSVLGCGFILVVVGCSSLVPVVWSVYSPQRDYARNNYSAQIQDQVYQAMNADTDLKARINSLYVNIAFNHTESGEYTLQDVDDVYLNVELAPNTYADQVEYFCRHLKHRDAAIISVHPHNDRGCGVAATELALMAGAERVEGTLFGNGERTGNADIVTIAMNMYSQGVDPKLDFSNLPAIRKIYEKCTKMKVHERHPYAGDLVFTAFSGSHQDAISKGKRYMRESGTEYWEVPYLPIDPADVGRQYEPIIRINSQSGKGGAAFIMQQNFGYDLPKAMHPEFGAIVKAKCDEKGVELKAEEIFQLFKEEYLTIHYPYNLKSYKLTEEGEGRVQFDGVIRYKHQDITVSGEGNGPIDAFFKAMKGIGIEHYEFVTYSEHALSEGADSQAVAYILLKTPDGREVYGVGQDHNIIMASIKGIVCAINRSMKDHATH